MKFRYLKNISTLSLDSSKCNKCGMCIRVCPQNVFELSKEGLRIIDRDRCMECGACQQNCPESALTVDAGVGCATAMIKSAITGKEVTCGCADDDSGDSCCC